MTLATTRTLVTGATGFLGRRLCQRLQSEGEYVIASGRQSKEGPWDAFIEVDLAEAPLPESTLEGVTTVYHLASKAHAVVETAADADTYKPVIVDGTRRVVEAAAKAKVKCLVYMSSAKAMGEGNAPGIPLDPLSESLPNSPQGPYGSAKAEAEKIVLESGIPHAVVLRPTMVFGPGEKGNLPRMVEAVRKGRFPPLPETGNRRSMLHVDDLVEFALRAATVPLAAGKVYILAHAEAVSTRELYNAIRESLALPPQNWSIPLILLRAAAAGGSLVGFIIGKRLPLDLDTLRKLTGSAWYSADRAERELGYKAEYSVKDWLKSGAGQFSNSAHS